MGRKSTIARLPAEVKQYVEGLLAEDRLTLDEMIADLRSRFPQQEAAGELPSRAALHRYGPKIERRLIAIKAFSQAAASIDANAGDATDARSSALTAIVQQEFFDTVMCLQDATDPDVDAEGRVALLGKAAQGLAALNRSSIQIKEHQAKVLERAKAAAEAVEKIATKGGLSAESVQKLRREILGIAA